MKQNLRERIRNQRIYFDGGFGSVLQSRGLKAGQPPEVWNLTHPQEIIALHKAYLAAGSQLITTNTFGVNRDKYENYQTLIEAAFTCAKTAAADYPDSYLAFDIGPTGRLLEPMGDLSFEDAVSLFAANIQVAVNCGAELILIETMNDSYETKAAVVAAKETCDLPIFVTNAYDEGGCLLSGADPQAMVALLEGLGVDALGMNCSFGPEQMLSLIDRFTQATSLPIIVNPNAGLPQLQNGVTVYHVDDTEFAENMVKLANKGACILGGCCGTTPSYIAKTVAATKALPYRLPEPKRQTTVSSYTHAVTIGNGPILIGERINPTGKPKLKQALRDNNMEYLLKEAFRQSEQGVHILDVNVGLPEMDEKAMMKQAVQSLQGVVNLPLQLDSSDPAVLEQAMRIYNGKPLINSVNGKPESMDRVFPLVKKYGGAIIALAIDQDGIPETAAERVNIIRRIINRAADYGIPPWDIIADPLALTVSSDPNGALVTLEAVHSLTELGICTSLGVSNISFGLPARELINATFFAQALEQGLSCAIINPLSDRMMEVYYAHRALHNQDPSCLDYIWYADRQSVTVEESAFANSKGISLKDAVIQGISTAAVREAQILLQTLTPLEVITEEIVPALNEVGVAFEEKRAYLPQLLASAEAATAAFEVVKTKLPKSAADMTRAVVLATVKGDIHDIGKNIVKVLLESYGFWVYDLGRDVNPSVVLDCVKKHGCRLVGLSALMTTTVPAMEETIRLLHETDPSICVMVGGAVLNQEYADLIHADFYGETAMDTVRFTEQFYG